MHVAICFGAHPKASCETLIQLGGIGLRARLRVQFGSVGNLGPVGSGGPVARFERASVLARFSFVPHTYMHTFIHQSAPTPIQPYIYPYIPPSGIDEYLHSDTFIQSIEKPHDAPVTLCSWASIDSLLLTSIRAPQTHPAVSTYMH